MRDTQQKFTAALAAVASEAGMELVDDRGWANTGTFRIAAPDSFASVVKMGYRFNDGYAEFDDVHPAELGDRDKMLRDLPGGPITKHGTHFPYVRTEELETRVLSRVRDLLASKP